MLTVAYLANQYPRAVEPYVGHEIEELRRRGVRAIACSVRKAKGPAQADLTLQPLQAWMLMRAAGLCLRKWSRISDLVGRVFWRGSEGPVRRLKALLHTGLGACYALRLADYEVEHIHVHHGYFGSWIGMVAARLLGVSYSLTLHGSDLLLHASYLDVKVGNSSCCLTISEYNRRHLLDRYPAIPPEKVVVSHLGVEIKEAVHLPPRARAGSTRLTLAAVGRLHPVKDHAFLVRACARLESSGVDFECSIAGDGPERRRLEALIRKHELESRVSLLGHVARGQMDSFYDRADVVVLTSRSEGIPLVLMEAMARGKIVLAPAITGIPELIADRKTGFLYEPGSLDDFLRQLLFIHSLLQVKLSSDFPSAANPLDWIRHAARTQVCHNFNRKKNLERLSDLFLSRAFISRLNPQTGNRFHENSVLQQIQLSVQRNRSLPVRIDGTDAGAGARSGPVFHG